MDPSNGYENIAADFITWRGQTPGGIGASVMRRWAKTLPARATVLDLGCGTGIPISHVLMEEGLQVYGVDASPTMVRAFRQNFPTAPVACETAQESVFFHRTFAAVVAWGLLFLLPQEAQERVISKAAQALQPGGRLLFTAPSQSVTWTDIMTGQESTSLGAETYAALLTAAGLSLGEEFTDEGENHYYHAVKY